MVDYTKYTLEQLNDVYQRIDRDKYPDRFHVILAEIEKREKAGEELNKSNNSSGFVFIAHLTLYVIVLICILVADHYFYLKGGSIIVFGALGLTSIISFFVNRAYSVKKAIVLTLLISPGALFMFITIGVNIVIALGYGP